MLHRRLWALPLLLFLTVCSCLEEGSALRLRVSEDERDYNLNGASVSVLDLADEGAVSFFVGNKVNGVDYGYVGIGQLPAPNTCQEHTLVRR